MKLKRHVVKVSGGGAFPVDMLRYDQLWPRHEFAAVIGEGGSSEITRSIQDGTGRHVIELMGLHEASWTPTEGRWSSFGWQVVEHYTL